MALLSSVATSLGVLNDYDNGVTSKEKLRNVSFSVLGLRAFAFARLGNLCPHFTTAVKHHVHVAIESFHASKYLSVVSAIDQYLAISLDCFGK